MKYDNIKTVLLLGSDAYGKYVIFLRRVQTFVIFIGYNTDNIHSRKDCDSL